MSSNNTDNLNPIVSCARIFFNNGSNSSLSTWLPPFHALNKQRESDLPDTETYTSQNACQPRKRVDLRALKAFVFSNYKKDSALYDVIVTEEDFLDALEVSAKIDIWLKLSRRIKN